MNNVLIHEFDASLAVEFRPRPDFNKTAILVRVPDAADEFTLDAPFGEQTMRGDFYVIAEGDASYAASRVEFEASHEEVEPGRWRKRSAIRAYQAKDRCVVYTDIGATPEAEVVAEVGDWIVRQPAGEVTVIKPAAFVERYEPVT